MPMFPWIQHAKIFTYLENILMESQNVIQDDYSIMIVDKSDISELKSRVSVA
jgi:hypothetical protein